jgi:hypothetical protein
MSIKIINTIKNMDLHAFKTLSYERSEALYDSTEVLTNKPIRKWKKSDIENWVGYWFNVYFGIQYDVNQEIIDNSKTYTEWLREYEDILMSTCNYTADSIMDIDQVVSFIDNSELEFDEGKFFLLKLTEIFGLKGLLCLGI